MVDTLIFFLCQNMRNNKNKHSVRVSCACNAFKPFGHWMRQFHFVCTKRMSIYLLLFFTESPIFQFKQFRPVDCSDALGCVIFMRWGVGGDFYKKK